MKKYLNVVIPLCLLLSISVFSQSMPDTTLKKNETKVIKSDISLTTVEGLSAEEFNLVINREFSKLITGQSSNTVGSFASLDITQPKVTFSPNYVFDSGNVFVAKISGGISDGIYEVFNNSKLNSNISMDLQLHFIDRKKQIINFDTDEYEKIIDASTEIKNNYLKDFLRVTSKQELNVLVLDSIALEKSIKDLQKKIEKCDVKSVKNKLEKDLLEAAKNLNYINIHLDSLSCDEKNKVVTDCCKLTLCNDLKKKKEDLLEAKKKLIDEIAYLDSSTTIRMYEKRKDSLSYEIKFSDLKRKILKTKMAKMKLYEWAGNETHKLLTKRADDLTEKSITNLRVEGLSAGWFSIAYKIQNDQFKLFSTAAAPADQITDKSFVSHEFRFQYSYFRFLPSASNTYFFTGGLKYNYGNNLSHLPKTEITEVTQYGQNRTSKDIYKAYTGNYKEGLSEFNINAEVYWFIFAKNQAAIHFFPDYDILEKQNPLLNLGVGLVFSFADQTKKGSVVNAELFYQMKDVFNTNGNDKDLFERNSVGLRFTFPINFNIN
jgi:hypothetical protein